MSKSNTNRLFEAFVDAVATVAAIAIIVALSIWLTGCRSADCGSRTVVGSHTALPKLSSDASDLDVEVYESVEGAVVYTRKDSRVEIEYANCYTNKVFGIWDKVGSMVLKVVIEPVETIAPTNNAPLYTMPLYTIEPLAAREPSGVAAGEAEKNGEP